MKKPCQPAFTKVGGDKVFNDLYREYTSNYKLLEKSYRKVRYLRMVLYYSYHNYRTPEQLLITISFSVHINFLYSGNENLKRQPCHQIHATSSDKYQGVASCEF